MNALQEAWRWVWIGLQYTWLDLQLIALYGMLHALDVASWARANPDEAIGAATGLLGAFLLAIKGKRAGYGWLAFLVSNAAWLHFAWRLDHPGQFVQTLGFIGTTLLGLWVWLVQPRWPAITARIGSLRAQAVPTPAKPIEPTTQPIDTGDVVEHGPSGEQWLVARATSNHVYPCGWPPSRANLSDCTLVTKATPAHRAELLQQIADGNGYHAEWARAIVAVARARAQLPLDAAEWQRRYAARLMHHGWNERAAIKESGYVWQSLEDAAETPAPEELADLDTAEVKR